MGHPEEKTKVKDKVKSLFGVKKKSVSAQDGRPTSEQAYIYKSEQELKATPVPQLVLADAPKNPLYGKKMDDDAVYAITSGKGDNVLPKVDGTAMTKGEIDKLLAGVRISQQIFVFPKESLSVFENEDVVEHRAL